MAQSLNKQVDFQTTGVFYLTIGNKVGKFLLGETALEFYPDVNIEQFIQIPWTSITQIGATVSRRKVGRHFEVQTLQGKFLFASKDSGLILKHARQHIGDDKVVKIQTLLQRLFSKRR